MLQLVTGHVSGYKAGFYFMYTGPSCSLDDVAVLHCFSDESKMVLAMISIDF